MALLPSIFPYLMRGPGEGLLAGEVLLALEVEPEVVLEKDIIVTSDDGDIVVTLEPEVVVEIE